MNSAFDLIYVEQALDDETLDSDERADLIADRNMLIKCIDEALAVAEAVKWCKDHEAMVDWDCDGVLVSICNAKEGDDPFDADQYDKCWPEAHAATLPAAVKELVERIKEEVK